MKNRIKSIFGLFCSAIILMTSVSCTKEDAKSGDSLVGTKWVMAWDDAKEIIEFTSGTDVRIYEADENLNYSDFLHEGKYSYNNGKVTFSDDKLFLADVWGITICYYYYFQSADVNGDVLTVHTTGKKLVIEDLTTGEHTITEVEGDTFKFMKVN